MRSVTSIAVFTASLLTSVAPVAFAQTADPQANAAPQSTTDDIVVVANRRAERLQDVPSAVTAVAGETLERSGLTSVASLTQIAPGLNLVRVNTAFQPVLRGVGTRNSATGDEPNVSVYLDGVYQPETASIAFELASVERVEVLRGPQGTLFGRNATGGLINVITRDPSHDPSAIVTAGYGEFNSFDAQFYGTTGLTNTLAVDLAAVLRTDDGFLTDISRGNDEVGDRESYTFRSKILFEPSETSSYTLTLGYTDSSDPTTQYTAPLDRNTRARALNPSVLIPSGEWETAPTLPHTGEVEQRQVALATSHEFSGVSFETTTAYAKTEAYSTTDEDGTPDDVLRIRGAHGSEFYSQEFRLLSNGDGPVQWIVGAFAFGGQGGFHPVEVFSSGALAQRFTAAQATESYAVFAEGTYSFADHWHLLLGARYTEETKEYGGIAYSGAGAVIATANGLEFSDDQLTYRASLRREFDFGNVYASYSRGFKSGTFNSATVSATQIAVRPEIVDAYEIGIKADLFPWLRTNLAVFHYDFTDLQLTGRDPVTGLTVLTNANEAQMDGAELEFTVRATSNLDITGYITYLDATYTDFPNAQVFNPTGAGGNVGSIVSVTGNNVMRAPEATFGLNVLYTHESAAGDVDFSTNIFHSGSYFWDVNNRLEQPSFTRVNAELALNVNNGPVRISLWDQNLTDEAVYGMMLPTTTSDLISFDRPRTLGVRVRAEF